MRRPTKSYNLQVISPILSEQWHPTKNGNLNPKDVAPRSPKKVWWRCEKGHSWQAIINSRSHGRGCPYCSGRFATEDNNLAKLRSDIAKQWHPDKNNPLKPADVKVFSRKKVWWRCEKGHEWQATVQLRAYGTRCPYCAGKRASSENNLKVLNSKLAAEWNKDKNGSLTSDMMLPGSRKKVWWKCLNGHDWHAAIFSRTAGCGCPYCSGRKVCENNCLQTVSPKLAEEWHLIKNGSLTPKDVLPFSHKKVWWICDKGHEWQAVIQSRTRGSGCRYCYKLKHSKVVGK